jgi:hypothetical protein
LLAQANIRDLCDQVIDLSEYRAQLYDYLTARMSAIAPNLTVLVSVFQGFVNQNPVGEARTSAEPA